MTLATHAVVGAAVASIVPDQPLLAFALAFASHFVVDAIPHWHYPVATIEHDKKNPLNNDMRINKQFPFDLMKIGFDALLGIALAYLFFQPLHEPWKISILIGALAGILPDPLSFVYWKFRHEPMLSLQRFHMWAHAKTTLDDNAVLGVSLQIILIFVAVFLAEVVPLSLG